MESCSKLSLTLLKIFNVSKLIFEEPEIIDLELVDFKKLLKYNSDSKRLLKF